ncbi:MAG: AbrB/MazE/SpoVT family DNA-binding domain-containing protein [Nanobdellota archaeon]
MSIRTIKVSKKRQITIPKSFDIIKEGESAYIITKKDEIVIKPIKEKNETAILSENSLADCWNSKEDEEAFSYLQK